MFNWTCHQVCFDLIITEKYFHVFVLLVFLVHFFLDFSFKAGHVHLQGRLNRKFIIRRGRIISELVTLVLWISRSLLTLGCKKLSYTCSISILCLSTDLFNLYSISSKFQLEFPIRKTKREFVDIWNQEITQFDLKLFKHDDLRLN